MTRATTGAAHVADAAARERILGDLDTNLLVEAGAGSGKTTALVGRMLAHVLRGTPVGEIAAVTFTRKAANELRERFQEKLEAEIARRRTTLLSCDEGDDAARLREERRLLETALRDLGRCFLGTVHAFCGRLLRERPLEAALDPAFEEVSEEAWDELQQEYWRRWVDRTRRASDPALAELRAVGLSPLSLFGAFRTVVLYPDVAFPLAESAAPDVTDCRRKLEALLARARALMPREEPADGHDPLMSLVRRLEFHRNVHDWSSVADFCAAIESIRKSHCGLTQKRWSAEAAGKKLAKALGEDFTALLENEIEGVLRCWREHRYPVVMRFLQRAAADFERERIATGKLNFQDLLLRAAALLREHPDARRDLGRRYRWLLVDEFQDTDPVQAEVCFLLTSDPEQGNDWRLVTPRAGALFVVGDPKQSIYRFRRADIQTYELVKQRIAACGAVLHLTRNFRSTAPIGALVNAHFARTFPEAATDVQAAFSPLLTSMDEGDLDGVSWYEIERQGADSKWPVIEEDAERLASWIARRIAAGERRPEDFLVLTHAKDVIAHYARSLSRRNVPVTTAGARLPQEHELRELLLVLQLLADPDNPVLVAAVLEGLFFGCSPADLLEARQARVQFTVTHRPSETEGRVGAALQRLYEWWIVSQRQSVDVLLDRLMDDTGLLAYAAGLDLGDARAGALLHLVESVRGPQAEATGLGAVMEHIESLLARDAADAPLRPGRGDAVRVMNLHKAKGLEAKVVVLAAPVARPEFPPTFHARRGERGDAEGWLVVRDGDQVIAQPPGWAEKEERETAFANAERDRLLYVAATRPMHELVVARLKRTIASGVQPDRSAWAALVPSLLGSEQVTGIALPLDPPPGRRTLEEPAVAIAARIVEAERRREAAAVPGVQLRTVTEGAKQELAQAREYDLPRAPADHAPPGAPPRALTGKAWGSAVHRVVEAMGRGRREESLARFARAVALDEGLDGSAADLLLSAATQVRTTEAWKALESSDGAHFELPVLRVSPGDGMVRLVEGVVDAAAKNGDGWLVVDWKTDAVEGEQWNDRRKAYERQVSEYATILAELTGTSGRGTIERVRR